GMSPVPMMNEMSTPTVHLCAQVVECARILKKKGKFIPDISFAGGFVNETQMYKAMAMSDLGDGPIVKSIAMARTPILAVMKGENFVKLAKEGKLPASFSGQYGNEPEKFFISSADVQKLRPDAKLGTDIPWGSVGLYTYWHDRIGEGLKQLMAGTRKFKLDCIERSDINALTEYASKVTGIETIDARAARVMKDLL
ncbi:MAG: FMN-binding glutamate synthase family protein, partial [Methanomassiliicoccaceae archaeon]|nr:FMN-binding glutamate synthase family protein [Methanomassiliicoccaceae archaeon]